MILLGRNVSPFVRRTAVVMNMLDVKFEQKMLSTADDQLEVYKSNPVGRIPALILNDSETLIDSNAIIDHIIESYDLNRQLLEVSGVKRRVVLQTTMLAHGVMEKGVAFSYEQNRRPKVKIYTNWLNHIQEQLENSLSALEKIAGTDSDWLHGNDITLADITVVCAFDYLRVRMPTIVNSNELVSLIDLSKRANEITAFGSTKPNI
jgi:glutathione S-transferase